MVTLIDVIGLIKYQHVMLNVRFFIYFILTTNQYISAFLGFSCPPDARAFGLGQEEFRYFRSPNDCQRYFVCVNNRPRLYDCGEGKAFNDLINACDGIENVTGCAGPQLSSNDFGGKGSAFRNYRI